MTPHHGTETKSVLEHVGELRKKIFVALFAFIAGASVAHYFHKEIIAFLLKPIGSQHLVFLSPLDPLFFILKIDSITGIVIAFPVLIWCIFSYVMPALPTRAKSLVAFFYITSTLLVVAGLAYAFFITIPLSLKFLFSITVPGIENTITAQNYIGFYIAQALIILVIFQVPIVIIGGIMLGAFKTTTLARKRRIIYLIVIIALSILTPTTDIFSLGIVLIPCLVIFEVSLIGGRMVEFFKRKK